jgi:hypothetical protein
MATHSPRPEVPGCLLLDCLYTVEELKLRLNWSGSTLEAAHCRGLRIYHLGGNAYCYGRDVLDFLRTMPKAVDWIDLAPSTPWLHDVDQGTADEAWAKAQGCCEACNGPAYGVSRDSATGRAQVLCKPHFEQAGGAS